MVSFWPTCVLLFLSVAGFEAAEAQGLTVNVTAQGDYVISRQDGTVWLRSAPTFFTVNWVTYSTADKQYKLHLKEFNQTKDGGYTRYNFLYQANKTDIVASVHVYGPDSVGFSVTYPDETTITLGKAADNVISGFPGFLIDPFPANYAYMSYGLSSLEAAVGRWQNVSTMVYGGRQGSGPLVLFDKNNNAIAMGPSSSFTVTSLWQDVEGAAVYWGIMGAVTKLPPRFQYSVLVSDGRGKVGDAVKYWGMGARFLPPSQDKLPPLWQGDPVLDTVGYWTGPGSAYYAGPEAGKTYEETLYDVKQDSSNYTRNEPRVDYMYVEVDDWWYQKGQGGGVKNWTAPKSVFPNGVAGMANKTRWSVAGACGVWASDNTYDKVNGGKYNFTAGQNCSLPNDQAFWDDLFEQAVEDWMRVFVQKDMEQQYMCMTSGDVDVSLALTWLSQMNVSASKNGLELMLSGAVPRLAMEAGFKFSAPLAVQVGPGPENLTAANLWKVGVANIFADALHVRPFYGIIKSHSASEQPSDTQLSPVLHSLLATLTGGPVAYGDKLGQSDKTLIDKCCSAEGQVLSPSIPARPIDDQLQELAWGPNGGSLGQVWTTHTATSFNTATPEANFYQGIIMATAMNRSHDLTPTSAGLVFPASTSGEKVYSPTKVYSYDNPYILHDFSDQKPFTLSGCTGQHFCLYYAAPVFKFKGLDVVLMGDLTKWVPMSPKRIVSVKMGDTIQVTTRGQPDEQVFIWFHVDQRLQSLEHRIGLDGTGVVEFELPPTNTACKMAAATGARYVFTLCVCLIAFGAKIW